MNGLFLWISVASGYINSRQIDSLVQILVEFRVRLRGEGRQ